jgi:hypothetical protein
MTLAQFTATSNVADAEEAEKALLFAFYHLKKSGVEEFSAGDAARWIHEARLGNPNVTRLGEKLRRSGGTVKGGEKRFRLHHNTITRLEASFPHLSVKSQDVVDDGTILPASLYGGTRGYVESLAKQINRSYEENIFDGCAVLMRRLEEILLIMSYEHHSIGNAIKDPNGNYLLLERIVNDAASNRTLNLGRNTKKDIEVFRELGNYSAHKIHYLCKREYIQEKIDKYRAMIDELLHKAGLR